MAPQLGTREYTNMLARQAQALGVRLPSQGQTARPAGPSSSILKPGGLNTLTNYRPPTIGQPRAGIVPQVYAGSTTTASGGQRDYTQPSSSFASAPQTTSATVHSAPAPSSSSGRAFDALKSAFGSAVSGVKGAAGQFVSDLKGGANSIASGLRDISPDIASTQVAGVGASVPTLPGGATATTTPATDVGREQTLKSNPYQTIDKAADSKTQRTQLNEIKTQQNAQQSSNVEAEKQRIMQQIAALQAQIVQQQGQETPPVEGLPEQNQQNQGFNPEGQSSISGLSAQYNALIAKLNELQQEPEEDPNYLAAENAVKAKEAEEEALKQKLAQGQQNIGQQAINYSFISGQQRALADQANLDFSRIATERIPLQQQLATRAAEKDRKERVRQSAIDVVKTQLGATGDERGRQTDIYKTNYLEAAKPKTTSNYTSTNIPSQILKEVMQNAKNATWEQLVRAYPDVSVTFLKSIWDNLHPKPTSNSLSALEAWANQ